MGDRQVTPFFRFGPRIDISSSIWVSSQVFVLGIKEKLETEVSISFVKSGIRSNPYFSKRLIA